jgi:antitoxin ParD1/3/4
MSTLAIQLDEELKLFMEESIRSGAFHSASEMVAVALRNFQAEYTARLARLESLRKDIAVGIEQAERGEFVEFDAESIIGSANARH